MSFPPQSIKAAQLAGAARRAPSTIRKLVWEGLLLGERDSPGHPRYTLADVAKLILMEELQLLGIEPARRIGMVNGIAEAVGEATESICKEIEATRQHVREGGPWAIFGRASGAGIQSFVTSKADDLAGTVAGEGGALVVVGLRQPIHLAYHRLGRVMAGELPEVSE